MSKNWNSLKKSLLKSKIWLNIKTWFAKVTQTNKLPDDIWDTWATPHLKKYSFPTADQIMMGQSVPIPYTLPPWWACLFMFVFFSWMASVLLHGLYERLPVTVYGQNFDWQTTCAESLDVWGPLTNANMPFMWFSYLTLWFTICSLLIEYIVDYNYFRTIRERHGCMFFLSIQVVLLNVIALIFCKHRLCVRLIKGGLLHKLLQYFGYATETFVENDSFCVNNYLILILFALIVFQIVCITLWYIFRSTLNQKSRVYVFGNYLVNYFSTGLALSLVAAMFTIVVTFLRNDSSQVTMIAFAGFELYRDLPYDVIDNIINTHLNTEFKSILNGYQDGRQIADFINNKVAENLSDLRQLYQGPDFDGNHKKMKLKILEWYDEYRSNHPLPSTQTQTPPWELRLRAMIKTIDEHPLIFGAGVIVVSMFLFSFFGK